MPQDAIEPLVAALTEAADGYDRLTEAVVAGDELAYDAARSAIFASERSLRAASQRLSRR
jgi:hypothetical protein